MASLEGPGKNHSFFYYLLMVLAFLLLAWGVYMYFEWKIRKLESHPGAYQPENIDIEEVSFGSSYKPNDIVIIKTSANIYKIQQT